MLSAFSGGIFINSKNPIGEGEHYLEFIAPLIIGSWERFLLV
jgi:hypothetical protein